MNSQFIIFLTSFIQILIYYLLELWPHLIWLILRVFHHWILCLFNFASLKQTTDPNTTPPCLNHQVHWAHGCIVSFIWGSNARTTEIGHYIFHWGDWVLENGDFIIIYGFNYSGSRKWWLHGWPWNPILQMGDAIGTPSPMGSKSDTTSWYWVF